MRDVKFQFFEMLKMVLQTYCIPRKECPKDQILLSEFKGGATESGYMPKYIKFAADRDIFKLVERRVFKKTACL